MASKIFQADKGAKLPLQATTHAAGYDLFAFSEGEWVGDVLIYNTGVRLTDSFPEGMHLKLFPRSSIIKTDLRLANSVGIIDPDYRDTIKVVFDVKPGVAVPDLVIYKKGDRIAQILIEKHFLEEKPNNKPKPARRGGFGSTGGGPGAKEATAKK